MAPAFHARPVEDGRAPGRSARGRDDTVVPMNGHSVLRTKPVEDVLAQGGDEDDGPGGRAGGHGSTLRRRLGPLDLMGFGVGIVIGTGIFTLTGIEAKNHAGPAVVISFAIAGVVSLLAALCYAELASAVPTAGSAYTYAYATIGEVFAWIIGWDLHPGVRARRGRRGPRLVGLPAGACSACRPRCSARRSIGQPRGDRHRAGAGRRRRRRHPGVAPG